MSKLLSFFLLFVLAFSAFTYAGQSDSGDGYRLQLRMMRTVEPGLPGKRPSGAWMVALEAPLPPLMEVLSPGTHEECNPGHKSSPHQNSRLSVAQNYERA